MTIGDLLDEVRNTVPECRVAAFIDSDTTLVLTVSAAERPQQEALDRLAEIAADIMPSHNNSSGPCLDQAILFDRHATLIFVRALAEPTEVICCTCSDSVDVENILASARVALDWIGKAG